MTVKIMRDEFTNQVAEVVEVVFRLMADDGTFAMIDRSSNAGAQWCNEETVTFNLRGHGSAFFEVETPQDALYARDHNMDWYNSSDRRPCHPDWHADAEALRKMRVVKVTKTLKVEVKASDVQYSNA